jgi:hypothetical protein
MRRWPLLLLSLLTLVGIAQNSAKPGTGTVTGHVYCADTNAPARMARVRLESVNDAQQHEGSNPQDSPDMPVGGIVQTALDGSFVIPNVPPGRYYIVASLPGYLSPRQNAGDDDEALPPAPAGQPPVVIPKVDVQADQAASADIRLERGAAVSGTIRFDDGSPAVGIHVGLVHTLQSQTKSSHPDDIGVRGNVVTNDLGRYRISGIRDGKYAVEALLSHLDLVPTANRETAFSDIIRSVLIVYSGDATRKSAASFFTLSPGEDRTGEDIVIPISKLHSVSGIVAAARDGHPVNAGHLALMTPEDKELVVDAEIAADGSFHIEAVPEGSYILHLRGAHDRVRGYSEGTIHEYGDPEQLLKVEGDILNLVLTVTEKSKQRVAGSQ